MKRLRFAGRSGLFGSATPLLIAAALAGSCADPVHDQLVASLGPEDPAIQPSEFHRAGQPCTACHGPEGPAKTQFAVAGTIFWRQTDTVGADQVVVSFADSLGAKPQVITNCVGNFFVQATSWPGGNGPAFPLLVSVYKDGTKLTQVMTTEIGRAGSCAQCHTDPPNYNTPGHIFLTRGQAIDPLPQDCPVDPTVKTPGIGR